VSNWNGQVVPFYANTSYSCANSTIFFANNRSQASWNMTCLPGGVWNVPAVWPTCISSKNHFFKPPYVDIIEKV
jgi:hypothetical protein